MHYAFYERLDVHVGASAREVIRAARRRLRPASRRSRAKRSERHALLRSVLKEHEDARRLYVDVMSGRIR